MTLLKSLMAQRERLEERIAIIEADLVAVNEKIAEAVAAELAKVRELQQKEFGAVNVTLDGYKVTETIPKKVKWDQSKLLDTFFAILSHGDTPSNYMKIELSVPEKKYEDFAPEIKAVFDPARSVEKGKPTLKIEEVEGA